MRSFLIIAGFIIIIASYIMAKLPEVSPPDKFYRPNIVVYGTTADALNQSLSDKCTLKWTRRIDPPFLDNIKTAQKQIDCLGYPFFGKRRFAEFVIADNSLEAVWILTTKEEEERFRDAMTEEYGSPDKVGKNIEIYSIAGAALRKDKPEVVFFSRKSESYIEAFVDNRE